MPRDLDPRNLDACIEGCAASHQLLLETVDSLSPDQFAADSSLPGWSVLQVVAHLALNAQSHVHLLSCAGRGEVGEQYVGGAIGRAAAIDASSSWSAEQAVKELRRAVYSLEGAWAGATYDTWNGTGVAASGAVLSMHELPFMRWREVVVHLTDMNIGLGYEEWPDFYVRQELERQRMAWAASHGIGLTLIPQAALALSDKHRLAWLLQRVEVDGLPLGPGL
jgi:maleylpyruvate isomerase